jgi:hypothetical protein
MKALISPTELRESGYRVAEVASVDFPVAQPLFWVDCANDVVADQFWYDPETQTIKPVPQPEPDQTTEG